jgi:hypothetical protein
MSRRDFSVLGAASECSSRDFVIEIVSDPDLRYVVGDVPDLSGGR